MDSDLQPAIAVVITAYDCAPYLGQAIESVLGQTRPAAEVIVVDDGSTDQCAAVTRAYGDRVQYHFQANAGSAAARNTGIRLAQAEWLALLDGDDYWEPGKLAAQMAAAAADAAVDAVFGHVRQFASPDLGAAETARLRVPPDPMPAYYASTMLIQREAFLRVGYFDERYRISEFVDWFCRAVEASLRFAILPDTVAWRRIHGNNTTSRNRDRRTEYTRVLKTMLDRRRQSPRSDAS